jgi:hypothetical protein
MKRTLLRGSALSLALVAMAAFGPLAALAGSSASDLPPAWHIHDGQTSLGPQHKGIGFFPTILGISSGTYLLDPASCPNATDKAFLPSSGSAESDLLRAGICLTDAYVIELRTVPDGVSGPDGWASLTVGSEPGWRTFYKITPR